MSEQLSIALPEGAQPGEYIIRQGKAEEVHNITPLTLSGDFGAPAEYVQKRGYVKREDWKTSCHAIFDKKKLSITFVEGEQEKGKTTVTGALRIHPFLDALKINDPTGHRKDDLLNIVRYKGHYFADRTAHKELVNLLRNWESSTKTDIKDSNSRTGQVEKSVNIDAKTPVAGKTFTVSVPFFEGHEKMPVTFTIEVEPSGGIPFLYLISETFEELWESAVEAKFEDQRPTFEDFVIIDK